MIKFCVDEFKNNELSTSFCLSFPEWIRTGLLGYTGIIDYAVRFSTLNAISPVVINCDLRRLYTSMI